MKVLAFLSLLILSATAVNTTQEVMNITGGVLVGFCETENLDFLASCIVDVGKAGYAITFMIEDFIIGDFEHVREGLWYMGELFEDIADAMYDCDEAGEVDIPALAEMAEIFKHPDDLLVQMGTDILLYHKSIKEDIYTGIDYFDIEEYYLAGYNWGAAAALVFFGKPRPFSTLNPDVDIEEYYLAGYNWGAAAALVFFGKPRPFSTLNPDAYNGYVVLSGFSTVQGMCDDGLRDMYSVIPDFGGEMMAAFQKVYEPKRYFQNNEEYVLFLHQIALVLARTQQLLQEQGLFADQDISYYYSGLHYATPEEITFEMTQYILAS
eukprot:CAMPEP_0202977278 /NCGR_PEP_ID=MMETSP1396-20130829/84159_1 /ASSEMBLY_ACC=CAM_ASM_000872 /TAXON_ID= /ORGANISM="Pseudokeronopsis sp., Strain Brazil" /LENGTH=321 /DNA_ID=CAMNT_0049716005 /DNA_START=13 /DNA_END=979 /DNA_ORIENTATION=-